MSKAILAVARSAGQLDVVIADLQENANVPLSNISAVVPDSSGFRDIAHVKSTKAPEGATTGILTGGIAGAAIGLLAGIGTLAIPGLGAFIAAGPLLAALSGAAAGAAAGGIVGTLIGLGIPEFEAKAYEEKLKTGHFLLAVHIENARQGSHVSEILKKNGLEDISAVSEENNDGER
ncbi:MAG: DUF3341 domain-containing protein [Chthoniobacterales bacterium]